MLYSHHDHPYIREPAVHFSHILAIDDRQHLTLYKLTIVHSLLDSGPVIVTLIEVVPVHLIDSNSEHLLILRVNPLSNQSLINQLVDV